MDGRDVFEREFHQEAQGVAFCPYRVCPLGAHVDHNLGKITGFALSAGIRVFYRAQPEGTVRVKSAQFSSEAAWTVGRTPKEKVGDWADYLRGISRILEVQYGATTGLSALICGEMPIGGLSSSAAVTISFLVAMCRVNRIRLSEDELVEIALSAEYDYVGVRCGRLDQSCEVYSKKDQLLYMDTKDNSYVTIPQSPKMKPYRIGIFFSGVERTLLGSGYNMRTDELRAAAYALTAYAGMEYGKFSEAYMRQVPREVFDRYQDRLPDNWRKRAAHFFTENARVEAGVEAWKRGDLEGFGKLVFESGASSIEQWETGSPELKKIYEIMRTTDGIYGGRFSGAGFKGCCMALVDPSYWDRICEKIEREYLREFPELKGRYAAFCCETADGVVG